MKIFISWSGKFSLEIGKVIKEWLTELVFKGEQLDIFISDDDIGSGADWLSVTKQNLIDSDCAIIVLTSGNVAVPWINFEAGAVAISANESHRAIPFLVDISASEIVSPLRHFQGVNLTKDKIGKLIRDIKQLGGFSSPTHISHCIDGMHAWLVRRVSEVRDNVERIYEHDSFTIYPDHIKGVKRGKVFVGIPMASASDDDYPAFKKCALSVKDALLRFANAKEVYCPAEEIPNRGKFDGYKKAIIKDFQVLKESEHYVFIYPKSVNSSILVEMGYAIALSKNTTIFARDKNHLPFMLKKADQVIDNLEIHEYDKLQDIVDIIQSEGEQFLTRGSGNAS